MKFFIDNNLSPKLARAMSALEGEHGDQVVHLREKFPQDISDENWMRSLSVDTDWFVITCDKRISKKPHELKAWKESGLVVFFLKSGWLSIGFWDIAWQLIKKWDDIKDFAEKAKPGDGYLILVVGKITQA